MTRTYWAAVVVNYEAGEALERCVRSLVADTSAGGPPAVVIVDNGSSDSSVAPVERGLPEVTVITPGSNLGYARAANLGIAATAAPVVAVLQPRPRRAAPGTAERCCADSRPSPTSPPSAP